jgi:uracil-DNA glycosylase family 4
VPAGPKKGFSVSGEGVPRPTATLDIEGEGALGALRRRIERCRRCPRLVRYRETLARQGEARTGEPHWGRPVAGFGDVEAHLVVVGLAPAARGANRTGRIFTGDRSATFLMRGLHSVGLASQPDSVSRTDGLRLRDVYITAAVRCVPPGNRPDPGEARNCRPYLVEEFRSLRHVRAVLALGGFAWDQSRRALEVAFEIPYPRSPFRHGGRVAPGPAVPVLWGSYHPSPRNTQTGLFTFDMFHQLLRRILKDASLPAPP